MKPKFFAVLGLAIAVTSCAFFEEPLDDLSVNVPSNRTPASLPTLDNTGTEPAPSQSPTTIPAASTASGNPSGIYFTVATLFDIPESAATMSFVHFTDRDQRREQAICEALLEQHSATSASEVPADAPNLIVWPVSTEGTTADCASMLDDYEPIDISNKTAERVNNDAEGPFILSRNSATGKRLIYDLSSVSRRSIKNTVDSWQALVGRDSASWPEYEKAR